MSSGVKTWKAYIPSIFIAAIFFAQYMVSFSGKFLLGTAFLLILFKLFWKEEWLTRVGIRIDRKQIFICLTLGFLFYFLGTILIPLQIEAAGGTYSHATGGLRRISPFFQALNEELVLRALLLSLLLRIFKNHLQTSFIAAVFFGALHWILYRYNFDGPVVLRPATLFNLVLFGLVCNELYFRFNHIGYGLALHAGWNLTRFAGDFRLGGERILEGTTFNIVEGSPLLSVALLLIFVLIITISSFFGRSTVKAGHS